MNDASRTTGGCSEHRIFLPYRKRLFFAPNASENASRTPGACFEHGTHIPYHRRPSPVPNATNGRKEKSIACSEYHKAKMRRHCLQRMPQIPKRRKHCLQRMPQLPEKRSPVRKAQPASSGKTKRERHQKSFSFQFGVRCGARTHDTQNHNLVLYQLN